MMNEAAVVINFFAAQKRATDLGFILKSLDSGQFELSQRSINKRTISTFTTRSESLNEINAFLYGIETQRKLNSK